MGLASLDAALAGLRTSQQQINVISNNVANVGTPGYSRKILPQSSQALNGVTVGVLTNTIIRNVDIKLERDLWTQVSAVGTFDVQQTYLNRIEQFHGDPAKELSIASEISRLHDSFAALADSPEDSFLLKNTVDKAVNTASKINKFSNLITTLRNDAQTEMRETVDRVNDILIQVSELNKQIKTNVNLGRTTALLEDKRGDAIKELSGFIEVSFFTRGDGVLVVQTNQGQELASEKPSVLTFRPLPLSASTSYPTSAAGVYVGDPVLNPVSAVDIASLSPGGKLGGLLELRDVIFPKQMAQLDELAHKMALRMDAQGLRLFTEASGSIPADTAPDPTTLPLPTSVEYVGFSSRIRVNQNILDDNTLLQSGTYGGTISTGSNELINRVLEHSFGSVSYQEAFNTNAATQVDLLNTGGDDLQNWLGLFSNSTLSGARDLSSFASPAALIASADGALDPGNDTFRLTFEESRIGAGPVNIDISLSAIADGGGNFLQDLIAHVTTVVIPGLPAPDQAALTAMDVQFSQGTNGQLLVRSHGSYIVDATNPAAPMQQRGLVFLGLSENVGNPVAPVDPYFDIQLGNTQAVRITLEPGDTDVDLIAKLQAVPGLAVDTTNFALDGILRLRPGNSYTSPDFGGPLKITGGPFQTSGATYGAPPAATARLAIDNGANIASALFGTYSVSGGIVQNSSPVIDRNYGSETNGSLAIPRPTLSFRETLLGPGADIQSGISGANSLIDFAQKMINEHSQQIILNQARAGDEKALRDLIDTQLLDQSGVNLDEELGHLITVQTAYSASARVLTAVDDLFKELLNAIR
ncbi:MAG: flagellar hook-associated protein FlgK [Alphaproteobacteria bacterium]|nr:flagellar hook-associated protein FlgK [Alphaproteobacteria bacterium]